MGLLDKALKKIMGRKSKKTSIKKHKKAVSSNKKKKLKPKIKKKAKSKKKTMKKRIVKPKKPKKKPAKKKKVKSKKFKLKKRIIKKKPVRKVKKKTKKKIIRKKTKKPAKKKVRKKATKKKKKPVTPRVELIEEKLSKKRSLKLLGEKEVEEFILKISGEEGHIVYKYLVNAYKDVDEYTLADKVELQINLVRSLLYKLYEHKLVSFFRERDKKKGWFIYSWRAHPEKMKYILVSSKEEQISHLKEMLKKKQDSFICESCGHNADYHHAMETMFFCDRCGGKYQAINSLKLQKNNREEIEILKKEIEEIKKI